MIDPEVRSNFPPPAPGQLTAWIELSSGKSLAAKSTIARHPGHEDFKRRAASGPMGSPYLILSFNALCNPSSATS